MESGLFADRSPLAWSDLMPSWPEDVDLGDEEPVRPVVTPSSTAPIDPSAWAAVRPAWRAATASSRPVSSPSAAASPVSGPPAGSAPGSVALAPSDFSRSGEAAVDPAAAGFDPASSAFGGDRGRFAALDPGRRGVKALAAVAAVVVLIAAFLAWRARPRVDPVPAPAVPGADGSRADAPGAGAAGAPAVPGAAAPPAGSAGPEVVVAVEGKVGRPGVVRLPAGARVADALAAAGGAQSGVDVALLNLARKVVDGELILVGITPPPGSTVAAGPAPPGGAPAGPVNLNTATVADLDTLPGVGPVLAQRILDARTAQGGFRAVTDLRKVEGIGAARFDQLKDLVTV